MEIGKSNHEMAEFSILGEFRRGASKNCWFVFERADYEVFRTVVERVPTVSVLKGKMVQESWMLLKKEDLEVQEQTVLLSAIR